MKTVSCSLVVLFATCAQSYAQTGLTGTWRAELTPPWTVVLRAEGTRLSGRVSSCASLPVEIYDGNINGNTVTFKCKSLDSDRTITFTGDIKGDEIVFTWEKHIRDRGVPADAAANAGFGASTPIRFTAKRIPPDSGVELAAAINVFPKGVKAEGTLLLPPKTGPVRAVIVVIRYGLGFQLEGDAQFRTLPATLDSGLLYVRISNIDQSAQLDVVRSAVIGGAEGLLMLLRRFAQESGHPELTDAPLLLWGHSAAGSFATTFAALHPQRMIAFVRYHSAGAGLLGVEVEDLSRMPGLLLAAGGDASRVGVEAFWRDRRSVGAPWTFAIEPNATHGDYDDLKKANDLVIPWIMAVVRQRVSPSGGPLRVISDASGWMGNNRTGEVAPSGTFPGSKAEASWLPDEASARGWRVVLGFGK